MIRHTMRALCAATLVIAPIALTATPAHAATSCTVNGVPRTADPMTHTISGTAGSDFISCPTVEAGDRVNGLGGNDYITVSGVVAGEVIGDLGADYLTTGNVTSTMITTGKVLGGPGNDFLRTGLNAGVVDGGLGWDYCRTAGGNAPLNCEV